MKRHSSRPSSLSYLEREQLRRGVAALHRVAEAGAAAERDARRRRLAHVAEHRLVVVERVAHEEDRGVGLEPPIELAQPPVDRVDHVRTVDHRLDSNDSTAIMRSYYTIC